MRAEDLLSIIIFVSSLLFWFKNVLILLQADLLGHIVIPGFVLKLFAVFLILVDVYFFRVIRKMNSIALISKKFFIFVINFWGIHMFYLNLFLKEPLRIVLRGYYLIYLTIGLSLVILRFPFYLISLPKQRKLVNSLFFFTVVVACLFESFLVIKQHFAASSLFSDVYLKYSYMFSNPEFIGGGFRGFGTFSCGYKVGEFLVYSFLLLLTVMSFFKKKLSNISILFIFFFIACLSLLAIYSTLFRLSYIQLLLGLIGWFLLYRISPVNFTIFSYMFAFFLQLLCLYMVKKNLIIYSGLINNVSLVDRMRHWVETIFILRNCKYGWLLGTGLVPNKFFADYLGLKNFLVDNTYLIFILHSGVIGLLISMFVFHKIFSISVKYAKVSNSVFWIALASYLFTIPSAMVLADQHLIPFFLFVFTFVVSPPIYRDLILILSKKNNISQSKKYIVEAREKRIK